MAAISFGEHVRNLRKAQGISLREAAKELHVSPSYLSKIEQDQVPPPSGKVIRDLAQLLRVSHQDLAVKAIGRRNEHTARKLGETRVELYALYRVVQDIDDIEVLRALLKEAYGKMGRSEEEIEIDLDRLRTELSELPELPRLSRTKESLLADPCKPRFLRKQHIEAMAEDVIREYLGRAGEYVPPTPVEELIEALPDTDLVLNDCWDPKGENQEPTVLGVSRFSRTNPHRKEIVISARLFESDQPHMKARLNFTLAHEMFHVIEHLELAKAGTGISLRRQIVLPPEIGKQVVRPSVRQRRLRMWIEDDNGPRRLTGDEDWREWQANYFAASLLMPREHLGREFEERFRRSSIETPDGMNVREYAFEVATTNITPHYVCDESLSSLFGVSGQAMAIRLMQAGLVV